MILDYNYNSYKRQFDVSYIEDNGSKQLISFNVNRFKAYYSTPKGKFKNWAGDNCDVRWVENPSKFEIKTFLTELDEKYKSVFSKKAFPNVYTFDIEAKKDQFTGEYSDASVASGEISVISVTSPDLNTLVLGTLPISNTEEDILTENFNKYVDNTAFFKSLKKKNPYVKYVRFYSEEEMLKYFLKNIVAKVPILTGWNCIRYDWQYIYNRIKNYYPNLSIKLASCSGKMVNKTHKDKFGNEFRLPMPEHTLIIDMMELIEQKDKKVLPMKESMKLDYIADAALGIRKIEYTKSLDDLYNNDYGRYIFYNAIDSFIVQLINYRFKTLDSIYLIARYCGEKIANCFGPIAITEAIIFNDFYKNGLKIVYEDQKPVRGKLVGAYVKKSVPGIHNFVCCNDFASLYPSTIRTCNLSFENYIGGFWLEEKLAPFKKSPKQYVVIGPNVFENEKTEKEPKAGKLLYTFLDEEKLAQYRNPNYFVTVNGCVYKNDKDYAFRRIQSDLQVARNRDKYLGKDIDSQVLMDLHHIIKGDCNRELAYKDSVVEVLKGLGFDIKCTNDLKLLTKEKQEELEAILEKEVVYFDSNQKAMKDIMNSMYGGASNVAFYWYNMNLANDITGESRNLIHLMEHHIPDHIKKEWPTLYDVHKQLNITVDKNKANEVLKNAYYVPKEVDPDTYNEPSFATPVYGDTDSCNSLTMMRLQKNGIETKMTIADWFDENFDKYKDKLIITHNGNEIIPTKDKILNYSEKGELEYQNVNYIMRHKVTKPKWCLKTKSGKEIIVTGDHSMIVFRNGNKLTVKPNEILPTDKILVVLD